MWQIILTVYLVWLFIMSIVHQAKKSYENFEDSSIIAGSMLGHITKFGIIFTCLIMGGFY